MKKTERVLSEAQHLLHGLSEPSVELIHNSNKLVVDIKKNQKDSMCYFVHFILKKGHDGHHLEKVGDIAAFVVEGIQLFNKIRDEMKR